MDLIGDMFLSVWSQAQNNHNAHSATGSTEEDIRFFGLGLVGDVANLIKKRWSDGEKHTDELRNACADVFAYNIMLAEALGMSPADLLDTVAFKQRDFLEKMTAKSSLNGGSENG